MVSLSRLRNCALISLSLLFLAGCEKLQPPTPTPTQPAAGPATPVTQKSATPNSFDEVTAQLDPGGDFYLYLSTAQWLGKLSSGISALHDTLLSGSATMSLEDRQKAEQSFSVLKDVVQKSGLEQVTGVGVSSFAMAPGLYRNKFFVHHYQGQDSGLLWSLSSKGGALKNLDLLPADTALASYGAFNLKQLIDFIRQEADQSGIPEFKQAVAQWQTQFAGITGLQLDDLLKSLDGGGSFGMVLTLDATNTVTLPSASQHIDLPAPRLAILIQVQNDLIFKQADKMLGANPGIIKVDQPGLQIRTMPFPMIPGLNLRPTVAQWNGFLIIASDDKLIRDMVAAQGGGPRFTSTPEYATLSAGLPTQGNNFAIVSQRFVDTVRKIQEQTIAHQPGANPAQAALMQRLFSGGYNTGHMMAVGTLLPNGWLSVSQGAQGSSQMLAPLAILPAAMGSAAMVPAFSFFHLGSHAVISSPSGTPPSPQPIPGTTP